MNTVTFSLSSAGSTVKVENCPTVPRTGRIFREGDYGEKGKYTAADIDAMAGKGALPINIEHRKSLFDGKLGSLEEWWADTDEQGTRCLFGRWREPEPLALLLGDTTRGASIEIDKATKKPVALALTYNPHITDAALFHAVEEACEKFSRGEEIELLDFAAESIAEAAAIPDEDFGDSPRRLYPVRTQAELRQAWQELVYAEDPTTVKAKLQEIATRKGLDWAKAQRSYTSQTPGMSLPAEDRTSYWDFSQAQDTMKIFIQQENGALVPATPEQIVTFTAGKVQIEAVPTLEAPEPTEREKELTARVEQMEADKRAAFSASIQSSAEAQADKLIDDKRILPADRAAYVAAFAVAARYDAQRADLAFFSADSEDAKFSLGEHIAAVFAKLPPHTLTEEEAGGANDDAIAVFEQEKTTVRDAQTGERKAINAAVDKQIATMSAGGPSAPNLTFSKSAG